MPRKPTKLLLVEGHDDLISVVELMSAYIPWPEEKKDAPVHITNCGGLGNLLDRDLIGASVKTPGLEALGIMVDADDRAETRWSSIRDLLLDTFPHLPKTLPPEGLSYEERGIRIGVWMMPDNVRDGSLETFLSYLVPETSQVLWQHAVMSVEKATACAMPCRESHLGKAQLYTFLAWQDPPGQLSGRALTKKILEPQGSGAKPFVDWFRKVFQL